MAKQTIHKRVVKTLIVGAGVFVLIILAGIITGVALIPIALLSFAVGGIGAPMIMGGLGILVGIYFLGFVFERFKPKLTKR